MDPRLSQALEQADLRSVKLKHLAQLKLKLHQDLTYAINGGIFDITQELIGFIFALDESIHTMIRSGTVLDRNARPILIEDLADFKKRIVLKYRNASENYRHEHDRISKAENIEELLGD